MQLGWLIEPKLFRQAVHFDLGRLWQESLAQRTARFRPNAMDNPSQDVLG